MQKEFIEIDLIDLKEDYIKRVFSLFVFMSQFHSGV